MKLIYFILFGVTNLLEGCYACSTWTTWRDCSVMCGHGTQLRHCLSPSVYVAIRQCKTYCYNQGTYTNGKCQCSPWRSGTCCSGCRHVSLPQCVSGYQSCGGTPDGIKCTRCNDAYYSTGYITHSSRYSYACKACPTIANCKQRYCSSSSNTRCRQCIDDLKLFKRTHSDTKCERMCAWNNHYCWPGSCSNDLTSGCICAPDFKRIQTSTETTCHPTKLPSFLLCNTIFIGTHGQSKRANTNKDGIQNCSSIEDTYGNFQLSLLQYELKTELKILISGYNQPSYIRNYKLGVTDISINVNKNAANGLTTRISHQQFGDATLNKTINNVRQDNGSIQIDQALSSVAEGESLCIEFEAFGGGYLESINLITQKVNPYVQYQKVSIKRSLCYTFDHTPPRHCRAIGSCNTEPLNILHPVTRTPINRVSFVGWTDPIPLNGSAKHASTIQDYTISVHQVISKKERLQLDYSTMYMKVINFSHTDTSLYLKPDKPTLYEVKLEVKDFAGNVQQARRFMLYDDTSFIETRDDKPIIVESASYLTNYIWQTRDAICLTWKDHFINRFYTNDNLLGPIHPEQNRLFTGVYEHKFGLLSVHGTLNVNGILKFSVTVFVNGKQTEETEATNIQEQSFCKNISNNDGDTFTIMVQAVDIAGNTKEENATVLIDQSKPELKLMNKSSKLGIIEAIELPMSSHNIKFIALDRHSGIHSIVWVFGIKNSGINIATGDIKVNTDTHLKSCHNGTSTCDCFDGKQCESFSYTLPVNALNLCDKKVKDHSNKNFYISITATNFALLEETRYIDVSIDFTSLDELCKTTNYVLIFVGVSCGISSILLVSIITFVIQVVRRRRRKNKQGSVENNGYILESYENLETVPKNKYKIKGKDTPGTKVTKQVHLENYQNLDHKDLCTEESYDNIAMHPEDGKTRRNTDQKPQRTENNVYEDIAPSKVTQQAHLKSYQDLNVKKMCTEESYDKIAIQVPEENDKTKRSTEQSLKRAESHIYEDIAQDNVKRPPQEKDVGKRPPPENDMKRPHPENDVKIPPLEIVVKIPPPEIDIKLPPQENDVKIPPPENDVKIPPPENDIKLPPQENDIKLPPQENDVKIPPPEIDIKLPPQENDVKIPPPENDVKIPPPEIDIKLPPQENVFKGPPPGNDVKRTPPIPPRCAVKQSNDREAPAHETHIYENLKI